MPVTIVSEATVLAEAQRLIAAAERRVWIASAWIRDAPLAALLRESLRELVERGVEIRIVYRVKEPSDFSITQFRELDRLAREHGVDVRFSRRLHAKILVVDDRAGLAGSSNLTATAGYTGYGGDWQNEEVGVLLEDEPAAVRDLARQFERIWETASFIAADVVGVAMDFPEARRFEFAATTEVRLGQFVVSTDAQGRRVLGAVRSVQGFNPSFPDLGPEIWRTRGVVTAPTERPGQLAHLRELFAQANKERGFQYASTFHAPESMFVVAEVEALKREREPGGDDLVAVTGPVAPGAAVTLPSEALLRAYIGAGDVELGTLRHHEDVPVAIDSAEICSTHLAVLGQTGSGKSNAVKVLLRRLLDHGGSGDRRVVVLDPHGEYVRPFGDGATQIRMVARDWVLQESVLASAGISGFNVKAGQELRREHRAALAEDEDVEAFLDRVETVAETLDADEPRQCLRAYLEALRPRVDDLCLRETERFERLVDVDGSDADFSAPGVYLVDMRHEDDPDLRGWTSHTVATAVYEQAKEHSDREEPRPAVLVYEEAQTLLPEDGYRDHPGLRASLRTGRRVSSEGRKFDVGVVISTQRPARVDKSVLAQCNSQLILRLVGQEDLLAVRGAFEGASEQLMSELPALDTGTAIASGTMISSAVAVAIPDIASLASVPSPEGRLVDAAEAPVDVPAF